MFMELCGGKVPVWHPCSLLFRKAQSSLRAFPNTPAYCLSILYAVSSANLLIRHGGEQNYAAVDELAAGASLLMGQSNEGIPAVHVRGFPYPLGKGSFREIPRDKGRDLFR